MLAFVLFLRRGPSPVTFSLPPPSLARGGGSLLVSVEANASRLQRERGGPADATAGRNLLQKS